MKCSYDNIGQLKSAIGTGGDSTENLGYAYDTAWNLSTRTNYGVSQAFAVNVKNELTTAVGLTCTYDSNGNLTYRIYDANGPKSYTYVYDDENQLIEMRTDTVYTPSGSRFRTLWTYDGLGRARVRTDYTWSGSASGKAEGRRQNEELSALSSVLESPHLQQRELICPGPAG